MTPELLSKLQNLSIKAKYVVEGFMIGLHKSPYHGFSVEFSSIDRMVLEMRLSILIGNYGPKQINIMSNSLKKKPI